MSDAGGDELLRLFLLLVDGALSADDAARLNALLRDDPAARDRFVLLSTHDGLLADLLAADRPAAPRPQPKRRVRLLAAAAAALVAVGLGVLALRPRAEAPQPRPDVLTPAAVVATLTKADGCRWDGEAARAGEKLTAGRALRLAAGRAELLFTGGAVVAVEGPAALDLVSGGRCSLTAGRAVARVPPAAVGFTVQTPACPVTDLGTEFGVSVAGGGATEVHVFQGAVAVGPKEDAVRLDDFAAGRVKPGERPAPIPADPEAFAGLRPGTARPLADGGFEARPWAAGMPAAAGRWGGRDVCRVVGAENGITPADGRRMLRFIHAEGQAGPTAASQVYQLIDLGPWRAAVDAGKVTARLTARFNRVAGDPRTTDTGFKAVLLAYRDAPDQFPAVYGDVMNRKKVRLGQQEKGFRSDADPRTWEVVAVVLPVPAGAAYLAAELAAIENVMNDHENEEFHGHYADAVVVELSGVDAVGR